MKPIKPGEIQSFKEELVEFPVRTELTVLPADPDSDKKIGWTFSSYQGTEIYLMDEDRLPLTNFDDLQPGTHVEVTTLVGRHRMVVARDDDGTLYAEDEGTIADLQFDIDDRHCWVSTYGMNKKAIERLKGIVG